MFKSCYIKLLFVRDKHLGNLFIWFPFLFSVKMYRKYYETQISIFYFFIIDLGTLLTWETVTNFNSGRDLYFDLLVEVGQIMQ